MRVSRYVCAAAVALGVALGGAVAHAQDAADRAIEAAKQFSGTTINTLEEAGLMAMLGQNFTGPQWEELTGIEVKVAESPYVELFPKTMIEHRGRTGAYDMLTISPAWLADLVTAGALEPLDEYMDKYGAREEFDDVNPAFKDYMSWKGQTYALMVDGDVFVLYYRKDIFEDPENQAAFKAQHGYDLAPPKTWKEFDEISQFITDKYAPETYGSGLIHTGYMHFFFSERFRNYGGKFFDLETMKATINSDVGVRGAHRPGGADQVDAARRGELGLHREPGCAFQRRYRDDHLLAARRALGGRTLRGRGRALLGAEDDGQGQGGLRRPARRPA